MPRSPSGRSALLLVPEIALTPAVAGQFYARFGDRVAILHCAFSDAERADQWRRIRAGGASVVVGTRSGVFAPVSNLGLIVVDEEHDASYKQEETPRYNGRDVAIVRAQAADACVVLGSATPSLESSFNAASGKYTLLEIPERIANRPMPRFRLSICGTNFSKPANTPSFPARLSKPFANVSPTMNRPCPAQSPWILHLRCLPRLRRARPVHQLLRYPDLSPRDRRLLCHYCGYAEKVPSRLPEMPERAHPLYGLRIRDASKTNCTANSPPRKSRASIATPSPASASSKTFCTTSANAISTFSSARR